MTEHTEGHTEERTKKPYTRRKTYTHKEETLTGGNILMRKTGKQLLMPRYSGSKLSLS